MDLVFDVMFENIKTAHVEVKNNQVMVQSFSDNPFMQPFQMKKPNMFHIHDFFVDRWFEPCRPDYQKLCDAVGVPSKNIYEIVRKTHGICYEDQLWVRFEGEEDLEWEALSHARN